MISELSGHNVVKVSTGKSHSLFLTNEGKVLAAGSNSSGQCGVGKRKDQLTTPKIIRTRVCIFYNTVPQTKRCSYHVCRFISIV